MESLNSKVFRNPYSFSEVHLRLYYEIFSCFDKDIEVWEAERKRVGEKETIIFAHAGTWRHRMFVHTGCIPNSESLILFTISCTYETILSCLHTVSYLMVRLCLDMCQFCLR